MRRPPFNIKWLYPGMYVKRWLLLLFVGITLGALGVAFALRELYIGGFRFPAWTYYITLQFWPRSARAVLLGVLSIACILIALTRLGRSLLAAVPTDGRPWSLVERVYAQRVQQRGPQVVAIGGGHGLSTLLSGLKEHTEEIVAIVNVADDGGSSGRLRREFGVLPPGDIRRCLAALAASDEALMAQLFEYRFPAGEGLEGHSFGNLFITALDDITGSFDQAVQAASKVLAVRGRVMAPTLEDVTLAADLLVPAGSAAHVIEGESFIAKGGLPISRVFLRPAAPKAYPAAVKALRLADLIVIGPGSLYTSLLPVLLVPEVREAIVASDALVVYVCNVATEPGETDHFGVQAHIQALIDHVGAEVVDIALANNNQQPANNFAPEWQGRSSLVPLDIADGRSAQLPLVGGVPVAAADLVNPDNPLRHDPHRLAAELMRLLRERRRMPLDRNGH